MKFTEHLGDMDPQLAANLERALDQVRKEFDDKITSTVEQTFAAVAEATPPTESVPTESVSAGPATTFDTVDELRLASLEIDTATSQTEILDALSKGALRFASRIAIFVNRGGDLHGWSAAGFGAADQEIKGVTLGGGEPFPNADQLHTGSVALSSEDCGAICGALGAESPSMGLMLPFVLGSQVVGTVYCDRLGDDEFSISALQVLTYIAGQTLETLPVRKRESTATLSLAGPAGDPGDPGTTEPAVEPAPEADVAEAAPTEEVSDVPPSAEPAGEAEPADEPETAEGADASFDYIPDPATQDSPTAQPALDEPTMSAPPVEVTPEPEPVVSEPDPAALSAVPAIDEEGTRPGFSTPEPTLSPPTVDEPAMPAPTYAAPPAESPAETLGDSDQVPAVGLSSTQVAPPNDLQGPGWAFTSGSEPSAANSDSENEEAQRLARLLVTEIKLYNEEAVEKGRREGDVYSRLQEDIDRSRQIFEDRIDPEVYGENDYFKQALVRILAGGDPALLGI